MTTWLHAHAQQLVYFVLLCFAVLCGGVLYFMFWEASWLTYPQHHIPVLSHVVAPGQNVSLFVERMSRDKTTRTYVTTVELSCNSLRKTVPLGAVPVSVEAGLTTKIGNNIIIPETVADEEESPPRPMPSGTCHLEGRAETQGLIRTIPVRWITDDFAVVAAPLK